MDNFGFMGGLALCIAAVFAPIAWTKVEQERVYMQCVTSVSERPPEHIAAICGPRPSK